VPDLPIVHRLFAHHDCIHNQLVSFHNRVCGKVPEPKTEAMARLKSYMVRIAKSLPTATPWSLDEVVMSYGGPKRARYEEAAREYRAHGLTKDQANVKMFIKCEKIKFSETKENPDPRAIQYRNPVFAVVFAQYIKAIEEVVYQLKGNRLNNLPPTKVFGKGLNSKQRASLLKEKWDSFKKPVVMCLDASRYDQHFDVQHLRVLHACYQIILTSDYFAMLCSWTTVNKVTTSRGLKYKTRGGRMSGDMDTALGAAFLMIGLLGCYFEHFPAVHWDMLDDGDDILLIMEQEDHLFHVDRLAPHFLQLGMQIKVDKVAFALEEVVWCQATPVQVGDGFRFVRNPSKVLSGALVGPKWKQINTERGRRALANTIGLGEAYLNKGIPVLQSFAQAIIRNAATKRQVKLGHNDSLTYKVRHEIGKSRLDKMPECPPEPVTDETRLSFALAFGISISEQLEYEQFLDKWNINFTTTMLQESPVDVPRWEWCEYDLERY